VGSKARPPAPRDAIVEQARLHATLAALSAIHYRGVSVSEWSGDRVDGSYYYDPLSGDRFCLRWNADRVVLAVFDHESDRSQYDLDDDAHTPLAHLGTDEPAMVALADGAAGELERLVTAWMWADRRAVSLSDPIELERFAPAHGLDLVVGFLVTPERAVFGPLFQSWSELFSLTRAQCSIALRTATAAGPIAIGSEESTALLVGKRAVTLVAAREAAAKLAALGITWEIPVAAIRTAVTGANAADEQRIAEALAPVDRALLEAARAGDVGAAKAALASGADRSCVTVEGQWKHTPAGDGAIVTALKAEQHECALALLEAGCAIEPANTFGQTALYWAIERGASEVADRLLAAGAPVVIASDTPLLHLAARAGDAAMAEKLITAGADTAATNRAGRTAAEWAAFAGHHALAQRLR